MLSLTWILSTGSELFKSSRLGTSRNVKFSTWTVQSNTTVLKVWRDSTERVLNRKCLVSKCAPGCNMWLCFWANRVSEIKGLRPETSSASSFASFAFTSLILENEMFASLPEVACSPWKMKHRHKQRLFNHKISRTLANPSTTASNSWIC